MKFKIVDKNKFIFALLTIILILIIAIIIIINLNKKEKNNNEEKEINNLKQNAIEVSTNIEIKKKEIKDWRLVLVNIDNALPENFTVELEDLDEYRQFDKRAIKQLKNMIEAERKAGASSMWVQSAYRSVEKQTKVFRFLPFY